MPKPPGGRWLRLGGEAPRLASRPALRLCRAGSPATLPRHTSSSSTPTASAAPAAGPPGRTTATSSRTSAATWWRPGGAGSSSTCSWTCHWLESKAEHGHVFDLALDFDAARRIAGDDPARRLNLNLLERGPPPRHPLHRPPSRRAVPVPVEPGWWYDCPEAALHYDPLPAAGRPKGRRGHALRPSGSPCCWRPGARPGSSPRRAWSGCAPPASGYPPGRAPACRLSWARGWVTSVAFAADGRRIVSGSGDQTVRVWDADSGARARLPPRARGLGHERGVRRPPAAALSAGRGTRRCGSGTRTAAASSPASAGTRDRSRAWRSTPTAAASSAGRMTRRCGSGTRTAAASSPASGGTRARSRAWRSTPDGRRIVSGSYDKTVRVWDADSGRELACLRGHDERVTSVAFARRPPHRQRVVRTRRCGSGTRTAAASSPASAGTRTRSRAWRSPPTAAASSAGRMTRRCGSGTRTAAASSPASAGMRARSRAWRSPRRPPHRQRVG